MHTAWTIAGAISGWVMVEFVAAATKIKMPILFNVGLAFVGGLAAYTFLR